MNDLDRWLTIPQVREYANVSDSYIRRHMKLPTANPRHLQAVKQAGQIKTRVSWVDDWITRTADDAA